ncbi:putative n-terminal acetyltransferase complex ard1 subunit [Leishmania major strain Friedlin]|uniref:Putative n-terminal acetyltransferase complex ard1 subunit n=1 Tax=Leishmania major TaxID=5664 RepID=Q4QA94_LEIMA|nr:putative n-terminal acetyltransferase complex ard1 subunit [Leishmania major strain Friedlin]CAJ04356.1 putative n-terminal acetyltransferase complex ard1 subunit [Leishmania major strain Friedlin]|eukprot:XP_001683754.1 putative n-terminal acetyltransferase complex ard1 subunit [Leishmania major strain Friedlin]
MLPSVVPLPFLSRFSCLRVRKERQKVNVNRAVVQQGDRRRTMTTYRRMTLCDTLQFNFVNLDQLTETYNTSFYGEYVTHWPEYQRVCVHPTTGIPMAYTLGKAEGQGEDYHGHVSAVSVAPTFRRVALGETLMVELAQMSELVHNAYFVDLFVRKSNQVAQDMYHRLGYIVYRTVLNYYHGDGPKGPFKSDEDALDMRLALRRDKERRKSSVIPLDRPIKPEELEWV